MLRLFTVCRRVLPLAAAGVLTLTPVVALADIGGSTAHAAVAAAQAKIDAASQGGASERASEILARAQASFAIAQREFQKDNETRAYHAANEAAAYAGLALATAELKAAEAQRDILRQSADPGAR